MAELLAGELGTAYVVETTRRRLLAIDLATGAVEIEAGSLPVASATGLGRRERDLFVPPGLPGMPRPFAGIAAMADGSLVIAANGDGSVLLVHPEERAR